jgi:predicted PurR-regulated permease PerM
MKRFRPGRAFGSGYKVRERGKSGYVSSTITNRGLLRAVLLAFALLLAYRFLAEVATTALLLATGLLLAVAISAPVEALHRREVPRPVSVAIIVLGAAVLLDLSGYLLLPVLVDQATDLVFAIANALSQLVERARDFAHSLGIRVGGGEGISPQTLAGVTRRILGGALGVFTGLISLLFGLIVVLSVPLYLAAMPEPVVGWVLRLFPQRRGREPANCSPKPARASSAGSAGGLSPWR